jgi:hypothetical protein
MSQDETRRLLAVASSLKARTLLSLGHGCGLRAGEASLKIVIELWRWASTPCTKRAIVSLPPLDTPKW